MPVDFAAVDLTAVDLAVVAFAAAAVFLVAAVLPAAARVPALLVVVTPAARLAAGLVVALFATAIVFSPSSETSVGRSFGGSTTRALRLFSVPAGVLRIPSLVSLSYSIERMLGLLGRCVRSESVHRGADVVVGLDAVMRKAPVVLVSTAVAHVITVHRKSAVHHRFL